MAGLRRKLEADPARPVHLLTVTPGLIAAQASERSSCDETGGYRMAVSRWRTGPEPGAFKPLDTKLDLYLTMR